MTSTLPPPILLALRAGALPADAFDVVRSALVGAGWSEGEASSVALDDAADCRALAGVLDEEGSLGLLATALRAQAGEAEVAAPVSAHVGAPPQAPLGLAIAHEAGALDAVAEILGRTTGIVPHDAIGLAVRGTAGPVELADRVLHALELGSGTVRLADAVGSVGPVDVVDGVLARVAPAAERPIGLGSALSGAAGAVDLAGDVMALLGLASPAAAPVAVPAAPVAPAASADPDMMLSAMLDRELSGADLQAATARIQDDRRARLTMTALAETGRVLREAIDTTQRTAPFVWPEVARAIGIEDPERVPGWDDTVLAPAVRGAAGKVDVVAGVLATIGGDMASSLGHADVPEPANTVYTARAAWSVFGALLAAAVLMFVFVPRLFAPADEPEFREVPATFAAAGEINVDEIRSGERASVYVETPVDASSPLIIWVDDGGAK